MSILTHSRDVDASHANISFATRDQTNYSGPTTNNSYFLSFSLFGPVNHIYRASQDSESSPYDNDFQAAESDALHPNKPDPRPHTTYQPTDCYVAIREAYVFIDRILAALGDPTDSLNYSYDLYSMLKTFRQIFCLTKYAVKAYKDTPLGHSLANVITPEVRYCCALLSELHDRIHDSWIPLVCTRIGHLWRHIFRRSWEGDELASLKSRLRHSEHSLGAFLIALKSYVLFANNSLQNNIKSW